MGNKQQQHVYTELNEADEKNDSHQKKTYRIFVYGALKNEEARKNKGIKIIKISSKTHVLNGYRLVWNRLVENNNPESLYYIENGNTEYTMLNIQKHEGGQVYGKLITVDKENLQEIDKLEKGYDRIKCTSNKPIYVYICTDPNYIGVAEPNPKYKQLAFQ